MTRRGFVYFTKRGAYNEPLPSNKFSNKSVKEIREANFSNFDYIGIRYNTYQELLPDDVILTKEYPLVVQPNKGISHRLDYAIFPMSETNKNTKYIIMNVVPDQMTMPKVIIPISPEMMSTYTIEQFLPYVSQQMDVEQIPEKITCDSAEVNPDTKLSDLYQSAKENNVIEYHCKLSESTVAEMKKRINIVMEIIETEKKYISDLDTIIQFWTPNFRKKKLLTDYEHNLLFADFPSILGCQKNFLEDCEKAYSGYATEVAGIFIKFAQYFRVAVNFIANYAQINDLMKEKKESSSFRKDLEEWGNQQNGRDFMSFMITPVQRIPRYQLFLRELLKHTPSSHPDIDILKEALGTIDQTSRMIDLETKKAAQMWHLKQIEKNLLNTFKIVIPDRRLIFDSDINVKGHSDNHGRIYIFNDIVLLTKVQSKGITVLFDSPSYAFHYTNVKDNPKAMIVSAVCKQYNQSIIAPRKDYLVIFPTVEKRSSFFNVLATVQSEHAQRAQLYIEWSLMKVSSNLPQTCAGAATANGKEYLFFGGQTTQQRNPSDSLIAVNQFTNAITEIPAGHAGRFGHTITMVGSRLFIIGGRSREKFFKKILCYDLKTDSWSVPLPNSGTGFEARCGHTTVLVETRMVIFGGKTEKDGILNSVTLFDPFKNTFEKVEGLSKAPPARYHHSACVVGNIMYIHGGKGAHKKILSDTWAFDIERRQWTEVGPTLRGILTPPRKCHAMFAVGDTIIIVGGCGTGGEPVETVRIDLQVGDCQRVLDVGNMPYALRKFSGFVDRSGRMYAFGGIERKSKVPSDSFYSLTPANRWMAAMTKSMDRGSGTLMEIAQRAQQKRMTINFTRGSPLELEKEQPPEPTSLEDGQSEIVRTPETAKPAPAKSGRREFAHSVNLQKKKPLLIDEVPLTRRPSNQVSYEPEIVLPPIEKVTPKVEEKVTPIEEKAPSDGQRLYVQPSEEELLVPKARRAKKPAPAKKEEPKKREEILEENLMTEIPILASPAFARPALVREESPVILEEKKAVSPSRPIAEVINEFMGTDEDKLLQPRARGKKM